MGTVTGSVAAIAGDEGLECAAEFGGKVVVADGLEQRYGRFVGLQLRETARTGGEVPLEVSVDIRRQVTLDEVGEETNQIGARTFGLDHSVDADVRAPAARHQLSLCRSGEL